MLLCLNKFKLTSDISELKKSTHIILPGVGAFPDCMSNLNKMKMVDSSGHYTADDETGFFFQQLKELQELLNGIFENEEPEENSGAKEKEK